MKVLAMRRRTEVAGRWIHARQCAAGALLWLGLLTAGTAWAQDIAAEVAQLNQRAAQLHSLGRSAEAIETARRALAMSETSLGAEHASTTNSLNNLALLLLSSGQYGQSLPLLQRLLAIQEKTLGLEHRAVATTLTYIAELHRLAGRYAEALPFDGRALAIREKALGPVHPETAQSLNNMALSYDRIGRYGDALPLYQRSLDIREKALGPEHPDTAQSLNNLAFLYTAMGQYRQALPLYQRALAIREKAFGPLHPRTADTLNNLALLYQSTGQYDQAIPLHRRALAIRERVAGPRHRDTAQSLNNLALSYKSIGDIEKALPLYQRALEISETVLGPEHPETATGLNNLAQLHVSAGRYGLALPLHQRALAIREKVLGPGHLDTAQSLNNLALLYQLTGRYDLALPLHRRALAIHEATVGPAHPDTAVSLGNLAALYRSKGQYAQALSLYQRGLAIQETALGQDAPAVATSLNNIAELYQSTARYDLALPLHQRALAIREKSLGRDHRDTALSLNNLARLYRSMGQDDQALPLFQRASYVAQSAGSVEVLWLVHGNLMALYAPSKTVSARSGNIPLAIWHGKQALNALQSVRVGLRSVDADTQRSFLAGKERYYTDLADLLVQEGRIPEAEQVLAMLKERELSDLLQRSDLRKTQADEVGIERRVGRENAELASQGVRLSNELAALERKESVAPLSAAETARKEELRKAAESWREDYRQWMSGLATLFAREGRSRQEAQDAGKQGTRLQNVVAADPGAVGLHYIVTEERIGIIVATAAGSFPRYSEVSRKDLRGQIDTLRRAIIDRGDALPAARALYRTLIEPVAKDLEDAKATTLVLSLTDSLRYVPFAALHDGQKYLIERHPLAMYASAGGAQAQASNAPWQVAALGLTKSRLGYNPLPAVKGELEGIVRTDASPQGVLPGRISLDEAFDKAHLDDALSGRYSVVHVASHFSFTPGDESKSVLLTGTGETISIRQLAVMNFRQVQQLTLSACETATGGGIDEDGAEVEGLAAAVQDRGAQSVLASLWKVADASTAQLMQRFYAQRTEGQLIARARALHVAQLALLRGGAQEPGITSSTERSAKREAPAGTSAAPLQTDPAKPYAHPYYWAPFVLSGNWL